MGFTQIQIECRSRIATINLELNNLCASIVENGVRLLK